jgi:hypothetical protein
LKKSRGISCSFGWLGVGITMPKSSALPSNLGCTVNVYLFNGVPGQKRLLGRLQNIRILRTEVAASCIDWRRRDTDC